ncbi:hypothetical protein ABT381_13905 [Streptomyces sp. NPDC000151]|uniref:hypothetical protein n=1 Tax=Streptomyces sp. NPDC000151 TaxID=3154244 RepID=UPI00331ED1BA
MESDQSGSGGDEGRGDAGRDGECGDGGRGGARDGAADEAVRRRAVALVQRILDGAYDGETELYAHLDWLEQALRCRYVSDLIFWPDVPPTAQEVVRQALAFGPAIPRPRDCPPDRTNAAR